ncbi:MAG: hypothetical protein AAF750_12655 [Planctomycetota bacterium]
MKPGAYFQLFAGYRLCPLLPGVLVITTVLLACTACSEQSHRDEVSSLLNLSAHTSDRWVLTPVYADADYPYVVAVSMSQEQFAAWKEKVTATQGFRDTGLGLPDQVLDRIVQMGLPPAHTKPDFVGELWSHGIICYAFEEEGQTQVWVYIEGSLTEF